MSLIKHSQKDWDEHFLKIAKLCSEMSKDPSTKVGAAIMAPDKSVVSTGYNGFPSTVKDTEEMLTDRQIKYKHIVHAEENALRFAKPWSKNLSNCTLYTTLFPCHNCYKIIKQSGIKRIVTLEPGDEHIKRWGESWNLVKEEAKEDNITIECLSICKET